MIFARFQEQLLKGIGQEVSRLRGTLGLSQEKLAALSGLHRSYIGDIERGQRNLAISNFVLLADALGSDAGRILSKSLTSVEELPKAWGLGSAYDAPSQSKEQIEELRLAAVETYELAGAPAAPIFKNVLQTLKEFTEVYDAGIAIVRKDEVRYYSELAEQYITLPRERSASAKVVATGDPLIIDDLLLDDDFKTHLSVCKTAIGTGYNFVDGMDRSYRFYAGVPLKTTEGLTVGAVYLLDVCPRSLTALQINALQSSAFLIERHMRVDVQKPEARSSP